LPETNEFNPLEKTLIIDLYNCKNKNADSVEKFKEIVEASESRVIKTISHSYHPGKSIVGLLEESHASTHNTPENRILYRSFHVASCGETNPLLCLPKAISFYKPEFGEFVYRKPIRIHILDQFPESFEKFKSTIGDLTHNLKEYKFSKLTNPAFNLYLGQFDLQALV